LWFYAPESWINSHQTLFMKKTKWNLEWNDGMSVGIPEIDEDHKRFISLIDELNHSITKRMKTTEIKRRLQHVIEDSNRHFEQEEKFFQERKYPNAEGHVRSHNNVRNMLKNIQDSFMPYGLGAEWLDAALVIKQILISHILAEDMLYADYFESIKTKSQGHSQVR
jgi:hemerythrin-like metal-binding protein